MILRARNYWEDHETQRLLVSALETRSSWMLGGLHKSVWWWVSWGLLWHHGQNSLFQAQSRFNADPIWPLYRKESRHERGEEKKRKGERPRHAGTACAGSYGSE